MVAVVPIDPWMHRQRPALLRMMALTEGPAEALLLPALLALGGPEAHFFGPAGLWSLAAQVTVPTDGRAYRVDFAASRGEHKVAIEVDGWAHHHATDEQEAYDNQRDLDLGRRGWVVLRCHAWKVFKAPMSCAEELAERLESVWLCARPLTPIPRTDDELDASIARMNVAISESVQNGHREDAELNQEKLNNLETRRAKRAAVKALTDAASARDGGAAEDGLLRELYARRAVQLGVK